MYAATTLTIHLALAACITAAALSAPPYQIRRQLMNSTASNPDTSQAQGNSYQCNCQSRKQQLQSLGATPFDLAVAFQETGGALSAGQYAAGDGKGGAAANFGLFKNNWFMIQQACPYLGSDEGLVAQTLNQDDQKAIQCQHDQISHFGMDSWYLGQRCGESGISRTVNAVMHTQEYRNGVEATLGFITQHLQDDMATWVNVPSVQGTDCN